jgi:hypothetical protein
LLASLGALARTRVRSDRMTARGCRPSIIYRFDYLSTVRGILVRPLALQTIKNAHGQMRNRRTVKSTNFYSPFVQRGDRLLLGLGEYVPRPNHYAQCVFIETLWRLVPEARTELEQLADSDEFDPRSIDSWAERFHLSNDWVIDGATMLVEAWREYPESRQAIWQSSVPSHRQGEGEQPRRWNPLLETEAEYDEYIEEYKSSIRQEAKAAGFLDTPIKRNREHFDWLVAHQVLVRTYEQIAEEYGSGDGITEASIGRAIVETAKQIHLTLRSAPKR